MARTSSASSIRFAALSKSGRGFCITIPRAMLEALGWMYPAQLELWIEGDTLMIHEALSARGRSHNTQADLEALADQLKRGAR